MEWGRVFSELLYVHIVHCRPFALVTIATLIDNVNNVSGGPNLTEFAGLSEGAAVSIGGGQTAFISYQGGADGNDIVLQTFSAIPEPSSLAILAMAGIGMMTRRRRN